MRILIVANDSSGLQNFRGMLIEQIIKRGHKVAAILPKSDDQFQIEAENQLKKIGCRIYHVAMERRSMNPMKDLKLIMSYKACLKRLNPDLVLTYTIKPNIYMGFLCAVRKISYAANITGLGSAFQRGELFSEGISLLYRIALNKAKVVFFENQGNLQHMVKKGIVKEKKACLLNGAGVDTEKFSYMEYPENDKEVEFLFIGRVMREKGIEELLLAMKKLINEGEKCKLSILGILEEDYLEKIRKYEKEGWLNYYGLQKDIRPYIKKSHCFVLPSWHEGMANTNLENASSGRPIITSNIHGCMEAVEDGISGYLCESKNVESLYKAIMKFVNLPYEEKKQMGIEGRKLVEKKFDKIQVVNKTMDNLF